MIPILFPSTETQFVSNGIGRLRDCVSCQVTEERNGVYELEFVYPVNGWRFSDIQEGMLIGVIHDDNHDIQPFEIYRAEASLEGTKTFYARHISYKLTNAIVSPFTASDASGAVSGIASNIINGYLFTFNTDKSNAGDFIVNRPASVRTALLGEEGSILDIYGGEYKFDKFSVSLLASRGRDTGVTVRYGKNMIGMEQEQDDGETFNAVAPYVITGDAIVYLPEYYVQPTNPPTQALKIRAVDFTSSFPTAPTEAELRQTAREWIDAARPWIPTSNIKIDFVALWQTEQYKNVAAIQRVGLCDTVSIYYTDLGIVAEKAKIIRTVFDVLTERFSGNRSRNASNAVCRGDRGFLRCWRVRSPGIRCRKRIRGDTERWSRGKLYRVFRLREGKLQTACDCGFLCELGGVLVRPSQSKRDDDHV